jgi:catechol 2,3-dioxygenase-like lactoylglutathione lyase family enzyme
MIEENIGGQMKLDMIGIAVKDMARSLEFYRKLGWEIPTGLDAEPHVEITLENGLRFAWDTLALMESLEPDFEIAPHGIGAFLCSSPSEVDSKYQELLKAGVVGHRPPWDAFWGQRYAIIKDPDGNTVDLFAAL